MGWKTPYPRGPSALLVSPPQISPSKMGPFPIRLGCGGTGKLLITVLCWVLSCLNLGVCVLVASKSKVPRRNRPWNGFHGQKTTPHVSCPGNRASSFTATVASQPFLASDFGVGRQDGTAFISPAECGDSADSRDFAPRKGFLNRGEAYRG